MIWVVLVVFLVAVVAGWQVYARTALPSSITSQEEFTTSQELSAARWAPRLLPRVEPVDTPALAPMLQNAEKPLGDMLVQKERSGLQLSPIKIKTTTRAKIRASKLEVPGYGLYSYLLFGANSVAGRPKRLAAARAYLALFPAVTDPAIKDLPKGNLNIFYVPWRGPTIGLDTLIKGGAEGMVTGQDINTSAEFLIERYDYTFARRLLRKIGEEGDGIYLVSYFKPLGRIDKPNPKKLLVQDLSGVREDLIELWIMEFRRQVRRQRYWSPLTLRNVMKELRTKLALIVPLVRFAGMAISE